MNTNIFSEVIKKIYETRLDRDVFNVDDRVMKLCEESGEAIGALLSIRNNSYKNLTYKDLREEIIDTWIVATDAMLTALPEEEGLDQDGINKHIIQIMEKKIEKWRKNSSVK